MLPNVGGEHYKHAAVAEGQKNMFYKLLTNQKIGPQQLVADSKQFQI